MNPVYTINLNKLEQNYRNFSRFGEIYFPVKTNHNPIILKKLKSLGSGFECDSIEHIKKIYSRKNAGKIIYSNVAKTEEDIKWAVKHKISFYTVDDEKTLILILQYAKKYNLKNLKINVRINVYDIFKKEFEEKKVADSRLGASAKTCKHLLDIINAEEGIKIEKGISFYVQAEFHNDEDILLKTSKYIADHFSKNDKLNWLNIGGGSSISRLNNSLKQMYQNLTQIGVEKIILEPGRFMVHEVEDLHIPVRRMIKTDLNGGETVVSLAVGIYHGLLDRKLHNRQFKFCVEKNGERLPLIKYDGYGEKLVLRGPTADSSDLLGEYRMPECKLDETTQFVAENVGAYVEVLHSDFSGKVPLDYKTLGK